MNDQEYADNPINQIAWAAFIRWAGEQPEIVARFRSETGTPALATDPGSVLVDRALGLPEKNAKAFLLWATREMWGEEWAPAKVREELRGTK